MTSTAPPRLTPRRPWTPGATVSLSRPARRSVAQPARDPAADAHPSAVRVGDIIGRLRCHVGPLASLRGHFGRIILVESSKVQDNCVMHGVPWTVARIEVDGHIGRGAVPHGRTIKRNAMVDMNAVVMDQGVVGESAIMAACAFVKAAMMIPPRKG